MNNSTFKLFLQAEQSFERSQRIFFNFINSKKIFSQKQRFEIAEALLLPQKNQDITYTEYKSNIIHLCWEKLSSHYSQNHPLVKDALNDLIEFSFYSQKTNNINMLSKIAKLIFDLKNLKKDSVIKQLER